MRDAIGGRGILSIRQLVSAFNLFDTDKDHRVTPSELKSGLERFEIFINDDQVAALIADFDKDGSG
jgi:Ca2+-binding EF-hand superfamily protein